jgi:hypothetical protein
MHGVAPKVAMEIGVFLDDDDLDTGTGQEIAEHEPGRAATDDAAARRDRSLAGSRRRRNRDLILGTHGDAQLTVGASRKLLKEA